MNWGLIIGPSGVGKGYGVFQIMEEYFAGKAFVSGDWCRGHAEEFASKGILVSDQLIISAAIAKYEKEVSMSNGDPFTFFIDAPRSIIQAHSFCQLFLDWGCEDLGSINTIHIHASPKVCLERLTERASRHGRIDDADAKTIARRLSFYYGEGSERWYESDSEPDDGVYGKGGVMNDVVPWLKAYTNYTMIDGNQDLEDIRNHVRLEIGPRLFGPVSVKHHTSVMQS